jgi:hypothetical protein
VFPDVCRRLVRIPLELHRSSLFVLRDRWFSLTPAAQPRRVTDLNAAPSAAAGG